MWEGTRSDTIVIVNIDPKTKTINAISIPRDSKVYLPDNHGIQKINSAHAIGGVDLVKKTLKETSVFTDIEKADILYSNMEKLLNKTSPGDF